MAFHLRQARPMKVVSVLTDDAIDDQETDLTLYMKTRNPKLIKELPGKQVTWITLRPLLPSLAASFRGGEGDTPEMMAFSFSFLSCSDPNVMSQMEFEGAGENRHISQSSVDKFPLELITELGEVAIRMASLTEGEGQRFAARPGWQGIRRELVPSSASCAAASEATPHDDSSTGATPLETL